MKAKRMALIFTAALTLLAAAPFLNRAVQTCAADTDAETVLPDWVPADYAAAGKHRSDNILIHNDLLCVVSTEYREADTYSFSFQPELFEMVSSALYEGESGVNFRVDVLKAVAPGCAAVLHTDLRLDQSSVMYAFFVDDDLNISQINLPNWFPQSFDNALSTYNRFGKTHIANGVLCTLFHETDSAAGWESIENRCKLRYTEDKLKLLCSVRFQKGNDLFLVSMFAGAAPGDAAVAHDDYAVNEAAYEYTFRIDDALNIKETDLCAWVPDCDLEFYYAHSDDDDARGSILTHDGYVAFLLETTGGTGYSWEEAANDPELAEYIERIDCSPLRIYTDGTAPSGGAIQEVRVYRTKQDGQLDLRLDLMPPGRDAEAAETVGGVMQITDNAGMVLLPGEARVTLINAGTGKPVIYPFDQGKAFYLDYLIGKENLNPQEGERFNVSSWLEIPSAVCKLPELGVMFAAEEYKLWMNASSLPQGYFGDAVYENGVCSGDNTITVSRFMDDIADITITVQFSAEGDMNNDGKFGPEDVVMLERWLTGSLDAVPDSWKAADFVNDDRLDARDLAVMKRRLAVRDASIAENGLRLKVHTEYGGYGIAGQDLGSGEFDTEYDVIAGDSFYEDYGGKWYQNVRLTSSLILRIEKIEADSVTVSLRPRREGDRIVKTVPIGEVLSDLVYSDHIVFDGINYSYEICFVTVN